MQGRFPRDHGDPIKIERFIVIRNDANYITFGGRATVYLTLPRALVDTLKKDFGLDLIKRPREARTFCVLAVEEGQPKIVFTFTPPAEDMAMLVKQRSGTEVT